jgi:hypothetical protein
MAGIKGVPSSVLEALQAQREQDRLVNEVRKRRRLEGALPPPSANKRESKALTPATVATLQLAVTTRDRGVPSIPLTPLLADQLLGSIEPTTANQYTAHIRRLHAWCAAAGLPGNPPSPLSFMAFVSAYTSSHTTSSGTRAVFAAMNFFADLAGYPSPALDPLAQRAKEAATRRLGTQSIPKSPLFAAELAPAHLPSQGAIVPSFREQAFSTHMLVLQAANGRFDDLFRANLGDLVNIPFSRIDAVIFGTKTDKDKRGLVASIPFSAEPGSAHYQLLALLARGATRLAGLPAQIRQPLVDSFCQTVAADSAKASPVPETIHRFPSGCLEPILALRSSLGLQMPVHSLPLFGAWLSSNSLCISSDLAQRASYKALLRQVKQLAPAAGLGPADVGCHSLRRGGATELQAAGASPGQLMLALHHKSLSSTLLYASPAAAAAALCALSNSGPV